MPSFPNSTPPSWYRHARWNTAADKRNGVHYVGDTVTITLTAALAADVTYEVRDYFGDIVSSGSVAGGAASFTPESPPGGWSPGWYRIYLIGIGYSADYAYSCGATNFCVIRDDPHFISMPAGDTAGGNLGEAPDFVAKGVMGIGTSRLQIGNAADITEWQDNLANCEDAAALTTTYWVDPGAPYADAARPRYAYCQFPNGGCDMLSLGGGAAPYGWVFCADGTIDGSTVFIEVVNGTNGGTGKLNVYSPNDTTLVENYDNINRSDSTALSTAINGSSDYIRFGGYNGTLANLVKTAIGRAKYDGVVDAVAALYALGVTHFEGPLNEPLASGVSGSPWVHAMRLFQAAVHEGNASAKAIGPCYVGIHWSTNQGWDDFLANGGADYCDEISFHAYNAMTNGDINQGRWALQAFVDLLDNYSVSKVLWQTESTQVMTPVYGVYHPRRSRVPLLQTLLMEQYGIAKERNNYWYDVSHGFWGFPVWWENMDGSLQPLAVLYRVLAEETWGKPYDSALDFGTLGNALYLGNVYVGSAGSVVALMATSYMAGASVVLSISGTEAPITVVDGFGNTTTMPQSKGRITIPMTDLPTYVELPVGAVATVYRINGHSPLGTGTSISSAATTKQIDGVTYTEIADGTYMFRYDIGWGIAPSGAGGYAIPPGNATLIWAADSLIERVMVWGGPNWQNSGAPTDFDIQTYNGSTWTTRKTVTRPMPDYFYFGTSGQQEGCFVETYWDEQWVFDVEFDSAVSCRGVRLNIRSASYGGEPLSASGFGQGCATQAYRIQEIAVTDVNRYAVVA